MRLGIEDDRQTRSSPQLSVRREATPTGASLPVASAENASFESLARRVDGAGANVLLGNLVEMTYEEWVSVMHRDVHTASGSHATSNTALHNDNRQRQNANLTPTGHRRSYSAI